MNVRDIITEALSRANIVPRRQAARGDIVETAYRLLQGIVKRYNNNNYLSFTQNEYVLHEPHDTNHIWNGIDNLALPSNVITAPAKEALPDAKQYVGSDIQGYVTNDTVNVYVPRQVMDTRILGRCEA